MPAPKLPKKKGTPVAETSSSAGTDVSLQDKIAALSPAKRALLEQRLEQGTSIMPGRSAARQSIRRLLDMSPVPLSSAQQRLWFLHQWDPESPLYNSPFLLRLHGDLNVLALQQALDALVARHEALRTRFDLRNGQPAQTPIPPFQVALRRVDSADGSWAMDEARRPFALSEGVLLRAALRQMNVQKHLLLLTMPHLVSDGWSRQILRRDLAAFYTAFCQDAVPVLPVLSIQYRDYAVWQQAQLASEEMQTHLTYWKKQLDGMPLASLLATDYTRPSVQSFLGARQTFCLPNSLLQALQHLAQAEGSTLFMILLSAFQVLLFRHTGQTDIVVGAPIAGRSRAETEDLIGCFINTLPLRSDLSEAPSFREFLRMVRQTCLDAYMHQDLPFEKLVQELQPSRDLSRAPLVQVMLVLQNAPAHQSMPSGLRWHSEEVDTATSKFDLSLSLEAHSDGLTGSVEYSTALFEPATITRLCGHFQTLLEGIVDDPDQRVSELPLLTPPERVQILDEWNATQMPIPEQCCFHHLFSAQAAETPQSIAVVFERKSLTYGQLNRKANQLTQRLRKLGVGPETLVGICVERSCDMLVGLLGILKAGGAYVPLDPHYPPDRLAFMLHDAAVPILLTQRNLVAGLPEHSAQIICLDEDWVSDTEDRDDCEGGAEHDHPAYVIYTSGSTGKPKGVVVTQGALVNLLLSMRRQPGLTSTDVFLAVSTLSFDISALELFGPLITGAKIVLASREVAQDPERLAGLLAASAATVMQATPVTWRLLLNAGWQSRPGLRILCGGEALPAVLARKLLAGGGRLWNLYGPTETTIYSSGLEIHADDVLESDAASVPLGPLIANTELYVLGPSLQPVPVGVPGELCIGGAGLARGYLNRPELTADKFIPNPFHGGLGAKMYRTGDLVRWRPDGDMEFLGRLDHQIKLRGYRIEMGEIESVLAAHPAVREVVVMVREDIPGDQRLVAYVVPIGETRPEGIEMRSFAAARLPGYMIPSAFVFLNALPLMPNGKRNRHALPAPGPKPAAVEAGYIAPRTPTEETVCRVWADVLQSERIGIHDGFFDFGGHSLLAMSAVSRLRDALGEDVSLRLLFEFQTPAGFVEALEKSRLRIAAAPQEGEHLSADLLPHHLLEEQQSEVDLRQLPAPEMVGTDRCDTYVAPFSPLHSVLQNIWEDLLAVRPIGIRDDFFDLGGHSLLAATLLKRIEDATGRRIPLAVLFTGPTIENLGEALLSKVEEPVAGMMAVRQSGSLPPLFFLHADFHGGGLYSFSLAKHLGPEQPFYAVPPLGTDGEPVPLSVVEIACRHLDAIRRFQPEGPYRLGGFCSGGLIAYEIARQLEAQGETVETVILIHSSPYSLRYHPLRRAMRQLARSLSIPELAVNQWLEKRHAALHHMLRSKKEMADEATTEHQRRQDATLNRYRMILGYHTFGRYSGQVTLFWPREERQRRRPLDRAWANLATAIEIIMVPGNHNSCVDEHAETLSMNIHDCLSHLPGTPYSG